MQEDFTFNGQRPDEQVDEMVKNHPFVLFWPGVKAVIILAIPVAVFFFFGASLFFTIATFVAIIIAFAIFSQSYYRYAASVLLITNQRVIYLDQKNFFSRKIIETNFSNIQDVASDTKGPVKTALDFGDLIIRTAGAGVGSEIIIKNISHPYDIQQEISKKIK